MTVFTLKMIAVLTMIIDHTASVLSFWHIVDYSVIEILHGVGRISFPIFAFLIANGYEHTRNQKKYFARLLIFAVISQLPYVWALKAANQNYTWFFYDNFNVFFTLAFGVYGIYACKTMETSLKKNLGLKSALLFLPLVIPFCVMKVDYGLWGILLILGCYLLRQKPNLRAVVIAAWGAITYVQIQFDLPNVYFHYVSWGFAVCLAAFLIWRYNGKKGPEFKYFFYWIYPIHLMALAGFSIFVFRRI